MRLMRNRLDSYFLTEFWLISYSGLIKYIGSRSGNVGFLNDKILCNYKYVELS